MRPEPFRAFSPPASRPAEFLEVVVAHLNGFRTEIPEPRNHANCLYRSGPSSAPSNYSCGSYDLDLEEIKYSPTKCDPNYYRFSLLMSNDTFLIHGLWVEQCAQCPSCGYPSFCNTSGTFDYRSIQSLLPALQTQWYPGTSIPVKNNKILAHEWCKHGTCTNMTEFQYFNTSLAIYEKLVDSSLLKLCNRIPSNECYFILDKDLKITNTTLSKDYTVRSSR